MRLAHVLRRKRERFAQRFTRIDTGELTRTRGLSEEPVRRAAKRIQSPHPSGLAPRCERVGERKEMQHLNMARVRNPHVWERRYAYLRCVLRVSDMGEQLRGKLLEHRAHKPAVAGLSGREELRRPVWRPNCDAPGAGLAAHPDKSEDECVLGFPLGEAKV